MIGIPTYKFMNMPGNKRIISLYATLRIYLYSIEVKLYLGNMPGFLFLVVAF